MTFLTAPPSEPEAKRSPSGDKVKDLMLDLCPVNRCKTLPDQKQFMTKFVCSEKASKIVFNRYGTYDQVKFYIDLRDINPVSNLWPCLLKVTFLPPVQKMELSKFGTWVDFKWMKFLCHLKINMPF